jgi:hypothetical protein
MAMGNNIIFLGTELKLNINIEPMGQVSMADYDFDVDVFAQSTNKHVIINKSEAKESDKDNYVVIIDTEKLGVGRVICKVTAYLPDGDFKDRNRKEVAVVDTGISIVKG